MTLPRSEYVCPNTLDETLHALHELGGSASILAGGTDLIPQMRRDGVGPEVLVDIGRLDGLRDVEVTERRMCVGALATHAELGSSPLTREAVPVLASACRAVGGAPVRNRGTVGGNLANASPAADSAPPLLVLDAVLQLATRDGVREVPLDEFFVAPGETKLRAGELITGITFDLPQARSAATFVKFGKRSEMAIAVVSAAAYVALAEGKDEIIDVRIALGSVAPVPFRPREAEDLLRGTAGEDSQIKDAARVAAGATRPISDVRASAGYRRLLSSVLVERALSGALKLAAES
jgi:CO/xanthine dehydrogenase FAD-binding subunit